MKTPHNILMLLFAVLFSSAGCGSKTVAIEERILPNRNPTVYEFDAVISVIKHAIKAARGEKWRDAQPPHQGTQIAWKGDGNLFAKHAYEDSGISDVAFLYGMGDCVGKSQVYIKGGNGLTYYADFKVVLTPANNPSRTRVEIIAQRCRVETGTEWHSFARAGIFIDVDPTSIEEYQILLDIGKQLGIHEMPKLITPDPKSPTRKIKRPRSR